MQILLNLLLGVAMLAWGVYITKTGILRVCGRSINDIAAKSFASRFWRLQAVVAGFAATVLVQSSNATALLISSFLTKKVVALAPALTMMLGADLGTAVMARILTFDLSFIYPLLLSFGIVLFLSKRKTKAGRIGRICIGLGIILFALKVIVTSSSAIVQSQNIRMILASINGEYAIAVVLGALLAMICYSSLAAVLLTALMAGFNHLDFTTALLLVVGANLGSCLLEIIGSWGQGIESRRVMFGNTCFKVTASFVILPFIGKIDPLVLDTDIKESVLWFHVLFNAAVCFCLLPFTSCYAKIMAQIFPDPPVVNDESRPKFLDYSVRDNPNLAVSNAVHESLRLTGFIHDMLCLLKENVTGKSNNAKSLMSMKFAVIEKLSHSVIAYLDSIDLDDDDQIGKRWHQALSASVSSVHAADIIRRMQIEVYSLNANPVTNMSAQSRANLIKLINIVNENLSFALNAFMTSSKSDREHLIRLKTNFKSLTDKYSIRELDNISIDSPSSSSIGALIVILIADLRQLNGVLCSFASFYWDKKRQINMQNESPLIQDE